MADPPSGRAWVLPLLAGLGLALAAPPQNVVVLGFAAGPVLCLALERAATPREGMIAAWLVGLVAHAIALAWVVPLLLTYGDFSLPVALALAAALFAAQSIPFALAGAAVVALRPAAREWITLPIALPVAMALVPAFFPWHVSTVELALLPYVQCVELSGPVTADVPMLYAGTALAFAWRAGSRGALVVAIAAIALPLGYGTLRLAQVRHERAAWPLLRVGVVQPDIDIPKKLDPITFPRQIELLHEQTRRLEARGAELVVWPETSYPFPVDHRLAADTWDSPFGMRADGVHGPLLVGAVTMEPPLHPGEADVQHNSVIAIARDGTVAGIVDKLHPIPFTEAAPFWDALPWTHRWFPTRGITPGTAPELLTIAGTRLLVTNCYEDVLGPATARAARARPALIVNVTNDAWFGATDEPWLHDGVARFRAIETRTDLVRSTNTGTSSHVAATGEELVHTRLFRPAAFIARARLRPARAARTPYVVLGDWLTPGLCGVLLGWAVKARSGRRSPAAWRRPGRPR